MKKLLVFSLVLLFSTGLLFADSNKASVGLVSVQWLKKHQNDDNLVLIDISKKEPFEQGHVAGAVNNYLLKSVNQTKGKLLYEVGDRVKVQSVLRELGVDNNSRVILIWPGDNLKSVYHATRVFFVLSNYGVNVAILDGGMKAWQGANFPVTAEVTPVKAGYVTLKNFHQTEIASMAEVRKSDKLIDNRPPAYYNGETKKKFVAKAGTIKGAANLPFSKFFTENWTFKSEKQVKSILSSYKVDNSSIFFCNTGNLASVAWFAAENIAGLDVKMYDGSMNEWANYPENPVE